MSQRRSGLAGLATIWAAFFCLLPQMAGAAQVSSGMGVGITIEYVAPGKSRPRSKSLGPIAVMKAAPALSYTWNAAALSVKRAGFQQPERVEKSAALYWFQAKRRDGYFRIAVSIASGQIIKVVPA